MNRIIRPHVGMWLSLPIMYTVINSTLMGHFGCSNIDEGSAFPPIFHPSPVSTNIVKAEFPLVCLSLVWGFVLPAAFGRSRQSAGGDVRCSLQQASLAMGDRPMMRCGASGRSRVPRRTVVIDEQRRQSSSAGFVMANLTPAPYRSHTVWIP